jgi:CPA1 family monovalent cation:H+ antiporter
VLYKLAVAAVVSGSFSLWEAGPEFLLSGIGGVAIGVAAGWVISALRSRIDDPPTEITISLLTGYAAYLPAEELGLSGVIAAVTVGLYMGWQAPRLINATTRIQTYAFWEIIQFLLNAVLFVLVGLQLPTVMDELDGWSGGELAGWAVLISVVVIITRIVWVFVLTYAPRLLSAGLREREPAPPWEQVMVVAWSGMRGSVSLAAALAVPFTVDGGGAFPSRDLILFLTFSVIFATLVLQGMTLPLVIKALGVEDDGVSDHEELVARIETARRARERVEELSGEPWVNADTVVRLRGLYDWRHRRFSARQDDNGDGGEYDLRSDSYQRLLREVINSQREVLIELRDNGDVTDEVMRRVERDLDLEESRLEG